jgi:DNA polymerase III epsilon subunit-like protein
MTDIMLDLETMSSAPDAALLSIGAVTFGDGEEKAFYAVIDPKTNQGRIDASTMQWWAAQSDQARAVFNDPEAVHVNVALLAFADFVKRFEDVRLWGNGSDFDNVVLRSAFDRAGMTAPWSHRQNRCYRTLRNLHPAHLFQPYGVGHNALDDARAQARHAQVILTAIDRMAEAAQ